jgi:hypothetical protein
LLLALDSIELMQTEAVATIYLQYPALKNDLFVFVRFLQPRASKVVTPINFMQKICSGSTKYQFVFKNNIGLTNYNF